MKSRVEFHRDDYLPAVRAKRCDKCKAFRYWAIIFGMLIGVLTIGVLIGHEVI